MKQPIKKRVVIKQELVDLTGDGVSALLLNQMLYWVQRTRDYQQFLDEEREGVAEGEHGWIYKSARELHEEIMMLVSLSSLHRHLDSLVADGWLQRRNNPRHRWDRTYQYRPALRRIQQALKERGYRLEQFPDVDAPSTAPRQPPSLEQQSVRMQRAGHEPQRSVAGRSVLLYRDESISHSDESISHSDESISQYDESISHGDESISQGDESISHSDGAIPENTVKSIKESSLENTSTTTSRNATLAMQPVVTERGSSGGGGGFSGKIQAILDVCDDLGIAEPARSELSRLSHVVVEGPAYVYAHVKDAPTIGAALYRIRHGWTRPDHHKRMVIPPDMLDLVAN